VAKIFGYSMIHLTKLFGNYRRIVLLRNQQIYKVHSAKKYINKFIIFQLNKDPSVWLDGARPPLRYVSECIQIKIVESCISLATKLFSDTNCQIVLCRESYDFKIFNIIFTTLYFLQN
jgi:hypothetical protein